MSRQTVVIHHFLSKPQSASETQNYSKLFFTKHFQRFFFPEYIHHLYNTKMFSLKQKCSTDKKPYPKEMKAALEQNTLGFLPSFNSHLSTRQLVGQKWSNNRNNACKRLFQYVSVSIFYSFRQEKN